MLSWEWVDGLVAHGEEGNVCRAETAGQQLGQRPPEGSVIQDKSIRYTRQVMASTCSSFGLLQMNEF